MNTPRFKPTAFVAAVLVLVGGSFYLFARPSPSNPGANGVSYTSATPASIASAVPSPATAPAKTSITWTPTSVSAILSPGETRTVSVNFTASKNIARASVQVSPALQSLVRVQPQFLDRVRKGQSRVITLTIAPAVGATLGTFAGTIQLKKEKKDPNDKDEGDEEPGKLLPQPLKVVIIAIPPDPGAPGKATLQGVDSDGDGIRDGLQRYIALTFPDSAKTRAALTQHYSIPSILIECKRQVPSN